MQVYRFRTMDNLLGEHQELKKQEIYLASPEQLNDPMEGLRDIFWRGDKIVWENFFNHYVFCLYQTHLHFLIAGPFIQLSANNIPILGRWDELPPPAQRLFNEVWDRFLDIAKIPEFIEALANTNRKIRDRELRLYLGLIHSVMFYEIEEIFCANGIMPQSAMRRPPEGLPPVGEKLVSALEAMTQLEEDEEKTDDVLRCGEAFIYGLRIEFQLSNILTGILKRNFLLLYIDFPSLYLKEIEKLLGFNWRVACFMEDYHNSSVWGTYGDKHKGACLIFDSIQLEEGLRQRHRFVRGLCKIDYRGKLNEIDFFRSIGGVTVRHTQLWYTDAEGNVSECGAHSSGHGEEYRKWHTRYWNTLYRDTTSKLKDWEHEREWRLILEKRWLDPGEAPKITYDFNSLKGIIFGIRASDKDILKTIKIIQNKCKCEEPERTDFKFYRAEYSPQTGDIRKNEILLPEALQNAR